MAKGRAQSGLNFLSGAISIFQPDQLGTCALSKEGRTSRPSERWAQREELRIDQIVEFLSPVFVQILQNDVLLDRPVAIALGQQGLAQIEVGLSEIRL